MIAGQAEQAVDDFALLLDRCVGATEIDAGILASCAIASECEIGGVAGVVHALAQQRRSIGAFEHGAAQLLGLGGCEKIVDRAFDPRLVGEKRAASRALPGSPNLRFRSGAVGLDGGGPEHDGQATAGDLELGERSPDPRVVREGEPHRTVDIERLREARGDGLRGIAEGNIATETARELGIDGSPEAAWRRSAGDQAGDQREPKHAANLTRALEPAGLVAGVFDGRDQTDHRHLVVDDLRLAARQVDLDGRHAGDFAQGVVDMFPAAVARHAGDPQGGDHEPVIAWRSSTYPCWG